MKENTVGNIITFSYNISLCLSDIASLFYKKPGLRTFDEEVRSNIMYIYNQEGTFGAIDYQKFLIMFGI